jgi:hypothetical protein
MARWVAARCADRNVLDASFPPGLITQQLRDSASHVVCVTRQQAVADTLAVEYGEGVEVRRAELAALPFSARSFGVVVCLSQESWPSGIEAIVDEFARLLDFDGECIMASGSGLPDDSSRLADALKQRFTHVEVLYRSDWLVSAWGATESALPKISETIAPRREAMPLTKAHPLYPDPVIIASNDGVPLGGDAAIAAEVDLAGWMAASEKWTEAARRSQARAERAEDAAAERDRLMRELFESEQALAREFASRSEFARDRAELERAQAYIGALTTTVSWRATAPLRKVRGILGAPITTVSRRIRQRARRTADTILQSLLTRARKSN